MNDEEKGKNSNILGIIAVLFVLAAVASGLSILNMTELRSTNTATENAIKNLSKDLSKKLDETQRMNNYMAYALWLNDLNESERFFVGNEIDKAQFDCINPQKNMHRIEFTSSIFQFTLGDNKTVSISKDLGLKCGEYNITEQRTAFMNCTEVCHDWREKAIEKLEKRITKEAVNLTVV